MDYYLKGPDGFPLEARVSIEDGRVTLHSRSGRPKNAAADFRGRNPDYVDAFDAIFYRLRLHPGAIQQVLLDSTPSHALPEEQRILATGSEVDAGPLDDVRSRIRSRMRAFGRSASLPAGEGNQNKKIRVDTRLSDGALRDLLDAFPLPAVVAASPGAGPAGDNTERLPATVLRKVGPDHIRTALARLDGGDPASNFDPARDYDAMTGDGRKYAPKKLFGLALEEALGIEAKPGHFLAGWNTPCFEILEECGIWIAPKPGGNGTPRPPKNAVGSPSEKLLPTDEERAWIEGNPRIATHLVKERQRGLAEKKRQQFIAANGRLYCERCKLDPEKGYGAEAGQACIEVHHHRAHIADMQQGHETSLEDLKCLCANCHRVLHRALSLGLPFDI